MVVVMDGRRRFQSTRGRASLWAEEGNPRRKMRFGKSEKASYTANTEKGDTGKTRVQLWRRKSPLSQ